MNAGRDGSAASAFGEAAPTRAARALADWLTAAPERLFLVFALATGLALVAAIPPLAGGNERFNFQRVAMIVAGEPGVGTTEVPRGVVALLEAAHAQFPQGRAPPYSYSRADFDALARIPLDARDRARLDPNPIAVLNPVAYAPQALAHFLGEAAGASPLALFYLGRLAGLFCGVALVAVAIRRMPFHNWALAALAMLPTILFSRSTLDADQVTNGLAFVFVAETLRAATRAGPLPGREWAALAALGFLAAQCKSAYCLTPALALAIPSARYGSRRGWALGTAAIVLPGLVATLAWMLTLKHGYFAGLRYETWAGAVDPDAQTARILADPLGYTGVLARTLAATPLLPTALLGLIGIFGPPVSLPVVAYALLVGLLAACLVSEGAAGRPAPPRFALALAVAIFAAAFGLVLTLLYIQWTGFGAPTIEGFQGRYLYPVLPPLLVALPRRAGAPLGLGAPAWALALAAASAAITLAVTFATYRA